MTHTPELGINLRATKGDSISLEADVVRVIDGVNQPVNLTGASVWFTAKRSYSDDDATAFIRKGTTNTTLDGIEVLDATGGQVVINIEPSDTSGLEAGTVMLLWDMQVLEADQTLTTVNYGRFALLDQVTLSA